MQQRRSQLCFPDILVHMHMLCVTITKTHTRARRRTHTHKAAHCILMTSGLERGKWSLNLISVSGCGAPVSCSSSECGSLPGASGVPKTCGGRGLRNQSVWQVRGTQQVPVIEGCVGGEKSLKALCTKTFHPITNRKIKTIRTPSNFEPVR